MIRNIIVCGVVSALVLFSGCDQNPDDNNTIYASWYIGTVKYEVKTVNRTTTSTTHSLMGSDNSSSMTIFFSSFPTTPGLYNYKVVDEQKAALNQLGPNECAIEINNGAADAYLSIGIDNDSVGFRVGGGPGFKIGCGDGNKALVRYKHINGTNGNIIDTVLCGNESLQEY